MAISIGTRLGPYEIIGPLGAGGMGEVYRARDTRLDRTVAIKILPMALAADTVLRDRFEREAKSLSALNHPNICTVHDVGRHGDIDFLVMEHLEGQTLAAVLERGPMPPRDALRLAIQIADALVQAHRRGIVHRDLKPANVMVGPSRGNAASSTATLLDFGLAKRAAAVAVVGTAAETGDATRASPLTGEGTLLGTFQYMAPEQLDGREADVRTDIWAFGCLLYEMLTGRRAFTAPTQAGLIAAILERQPEPIVLPDAALTPAVNRLVAACLEKNPDDRFQSMRDVRRELEWTAAGLFSFPDPPAPGLRSRLLIPAVMLLGVAVLAVAAILKRPPAPVSTPTAFFTISPGAAGYTVGPHGIFGGAGSGTPHVAPDGNRIAFIAHSATEATIWLRDLSKLDAVPIRGTSGARGLFWSPDGASLGFFAGGKLKIIELSSGRVEILCDAPQAFGGTWGPGGTILFSPDERSPIHRVNATGGTPTPVTTLASDGEDVHRWPYLLADGRHFLYTSWADGTTTRDVKVGSFDGTPART